MAGFSLDDPKGLGQFFDGPRSHQNPGGTRSQAWSVGEAIRALSEYGAPGAAAR
jgi:glycogen debranching enzyme